MRFSEAAIARSLVPALTDDDDTGREVDDDFGFDESSCCLPVVVVVVIGVRVERTGRTAVRVTIFEVLLGFVPGCCCELALALEEVAVAGAVEGLLLLLLLSGEEAYEVVVVL